MVLAILSLTPWRALELPLIPGSRTLEPMEKKTRIHFPLLSFELKRFYRETLLPGAACSKALTMRVSLNRQETLP
jgi:hypothetical protein